MTKLKQQNIAVIGTGISGLSAAWLLNTQNNVTVFEKECRLGGHSNTAYVNNNGVRQPVDTGFIVYNEKNYPNLTELFKFLDVPTQATEMSFSVSLNKSNLEFGSTGINSLFGQRSNIFKKSFWRMISDIRSFFIDANQFLATDNLNSSTLKEFIAKNNYGDEFINNFILPMGAAIWSSSTSNILSQSTASFLNFFNSHGLLTFNSPVSWRTVSGGSVEYVNRISSSFLSKILTNTGVKSVVRENDLVKIIDQNNKNYEFDKVVIATHADSAYKMLASPSPEERALLNKFKYTRNHVILHSDPKLMPKRKAVWASWNFLGSTEKNPTVTYWMNHLQSLPDSLPLFVTVNPTSDIDPNLTHARFEYAHPVLNSETLNAQKQLWQIQGHGNVWFCGSYFGYGFHEDGIQSGLAVAEEIGNILRPWSVKNHSSRIFRKPI